ncbi:MAG: hypothetical protein AAFR55_02025 [Pseudomonadota bacterium]
MSAVKPRAHVVRAAPVAIRTAARVDIDIDIDIDIDAGRRSSNVMRVTCRLPALLFIDPRIAHAHDAAAICACEQSPVQHHAARETTDASGFVITGGVWY